MLTLVIAVPRLSLSVALFILTFTNTALTQLLPPMCRADASHRYAVSCTKRTDGRSDCHARARSEELTDALCLKAQGTS